MTTNVLDEFKEISNTLNTFKNRAMKINAIVENAQQQAEKFKEAAEKKFNVSTPEELEVVIQNTDKENLEKLAVFRKEVEDLQNSVLSKEELIKKVQEENQ